MQGIPPDEQAAQRMSAKIKVCSGVLHPEGAVFPITDEHWYFRKSGEYAGHPYHPCRACRQEMLAIKKGVKRGYVPIAAIFPHLQELYLRLGKSARATAAYTGVSLPAIRAILAKKRRDVHKHTAQLILAALIRKRQEDRTNGNHAEFRKAKHYQARVEERLLELTGY